MSVTLCYLLGYPLPTRSCNGVGCIRLLIASPAQSHSVSMRMGLTHLPPTFNAKLFGYSDCTIVVFIQIVVAVCARFPHDSRYTISLFPPWFDADERPFDLAQ